MRYSHRFIRPLFIVISILSFSITGCSPEDTGGVNSIVPTVEDGTASLEGAAPDDLADADASALDATEASHLRFMREEEKLARDVYLILAALYPDQPIFNQIATRAEQTHTDTMRDKLDQFNLPDPNPKTNDLPSSIGVFTGDEWGWYFTDKFELLTAKGEISELDALYVGAFIEELDMYDIAVCPRIMVDRGFTSPCGLEYTDESALQTAYSSLISGSESHLRAYVRQIEAVIGVGNYKAQYITQDEVDEILGR